MAAPLTASLPPGLHLDDGYTIRLAAIDPSTGGSVAGVKFTDVSYMVDQLAGQPLDTVGIKQLLVKQTNQGG